MTQISEADFNKALSVGRPPNIRHLFPNSRALLVSGKYIDLAMLAKGQAIADSMGWEFVHRPVGYGALETRLVELMDGVEGRQ